MKNQQQKIFMIGIGGAGMKALAAILSAQGHRISGTDYDFEKIRQSEDLQDFEIAPEDSAKTLLVEADRVIYSDAVPATHPLRSIAAANNIPQSMLFEAVGEVAQEFTTIAVTGTHGKSSTTAFLGHILIETGRDPTVQIGAAVASWNHHHARIGQGKYFVVEADEYRRHFLSLKPAHIIITAIDFDHPDYFTSLKDVKQAYRDFLLQLQPGGCVVVLDDVYQEHPDLPWPKSTIVVPKPTKKIPLVIPGQHMQNNAALALALAEKLGISNKDGASALANFTGLSRRFELLGMIDSLKIISDYGHHPTEIAATLRAAREEYPHNRLIAIIEPHTTQRVTAFLDLYVETLAAAPIDGVIIYPTFFVKGRENQAAAQMSSSQIYQAVKNRLPQAWQVESAHALQVLLQQQAGNFDQAIAFTAGVLDQELRQLIT